MGKAKFFLFRLTLLSAICAVFFPVFYPDTHAWTWLVFTADYLLGNPGPFRAYRDQLMEDAYKSWPVPRDVHLPAQPFREMDGGEGYSHELFKELTFGYTKPIIIRGLFKDSAATKKWTAEWLADYMKDRPFVSFVNSSVGSGSKDTANTYVTNVRTVVDNITKGGKNYIFNANLDFHKDEEMAKDLEIERLGWPQEPALVQFFIGLSRPGEIPTGSPLHASIAPNLNFQLSGQKEWVMIDPEYLIYTKPQLLDRQFALLHGSDFRPIGQRWQNMPRLEGKVYAGDAIYIPPYWYHEVRNDPVEDWQISIALRYWSTSASLRNQPWLAMAQDFGVAGRPCARGTRVLICGPYASKAGGWTKDLAAQRQSEAASEGASLVSKMNFENVERDYE